MPNKIRQYTDHAGSMPSHRTVMSVFTQSPLPLWYYSMARGGSGSSGTLEGTLTALRLESDGEHAGKKIATVEVTQVPCGREDLMPEVEFDPESGLVITPIEVDVVDHSGCVFDHDEEDLIGAHIWASERVSVNQGYDPRETIPDPEDPEGPEIPNPHYNPVKFGDCHWAADDRCCVDADYPPPEPE